MIRLVFHMKHDPSEYSTQDENELLFSNNYIVHTITTKTLKTGYVYCISITELYKISPNFSPVMFHMKHIE